MIQRLRSRSGLSAEYMQAAKIEWPRPLAIGRPVHVAIVNATLPVKRETNVRL